MSINRLNGNNSSFDFSVSKNSRAAKAGAAAGQGGAVQSAGAKPSAQGNGDILAISTIAGAAGGGVAAAQVSLGGGSLPSTTAISALKGAAVEMTKENRENQTIMALAQQIVNDMFAA